jgi:BolA protein
MRETDLAAMLASLEGEAMTVRDRLMTIFAAALRPSSLEVIDESHQHAGHAGWRPGGETHMRVRVVSEAFAGKSRLDRHRMVNELAAAELHGGLHALAIEASAPNESMQAGPRPVRDGTQ